MAVKPSDRQCDAECRSPASRDGDIWCQNVRACTDCKGPGGRVCRCELWSLPKENPDPDKDWKKEADPGVKVTKDDSRTYRCYCQDPPPPPPPGGEGAPSSSSR